MRQREAARSTKHVDGAIFPALLGAGTVFVLGAMSPGPSLAVVLRNTLTGGGAVAWPAPWAASAGVYALVAVFSLIALLEAAEQALPVLRVLGALVLLMFARWTWTSADSPPAVQHEQQARIGPNRLCRGRCHRLPEPQNRGLHGRRAFAGPRTRHVAVDQGRHRWARDGDRHDMVPDRPLPVEQAARGCARTQKQRPEPRLSGGLAGLAVWTMAKSSFAKQGQLGVNRIS